MDAYDGDFQMNVKAYIYRGLLGLALGLTWSAGAQGQTPLPSANQQLVYPGDVIKLWIWREEELSGEFLVPQSGFVVFPKIGAWKVTETPMVQLRDTLLLEFQKFLRNPSIEVTFLRRINVLGAVRKPGVYPLDATMTVAMALAMAEGTTPEGRPDQVELLRAGEKLVANINQRTRIGDLPIQSGDQLYVPERSWVTRNAGTIISGAISLLSVTIAILAR